jgi:glutamine cyclotransferase
VNGVATALAMATGLVLGAASWPPSQAPSPTPVTELGYEIVSVRPHDTQAWTEGLLLDADGRLFESTGISGQTSLREVDPITGVVLRSVSPDGPEYGEGLALVDDRFIQLTWQDGVALLWDADTFAPAGRIPYAGEGWGLCHDGERLIMSDGSETLTFRDPTTFDTIGSVAVTLRGEPLDRLNELECVEGWVWANVWETDEIVRIDPATGVVTGILDASGLIEPHPALVDPGAVLNGIAFDPAAGTFLLTGKLWPSLFEVRLVEAPTPSSATAPRA